MKTKKDHIPRPKAPEQRWGSLTDQECENHHQAHIRRVVAAHFMVGYGHWWGCHCGAVYTAAERNKRIAESAHAGHIQCIKDVIEQNRMNGGPE